ncbi:hypothetical protein CMV16_19565 [Peribacillus simplex]|nr:hypothetical protein CMV16_19565 [Peribacillus simplex]
MIEERKDPFAKGFRLQANSKEIEFACSFFILKTCKVLSEIRPLSAECKRMPEAPSPSFY